MAISASSSSFWLEVINVVMVPLAIAGSLLVGASIARREYRMRFLTEEWSNLMHFVFTHPHFMVAERNCNYQESYPSMDECKQYEMFARICIAYVDDLYFLRFGSSQNGWLKGAIPLLIGTHAAWFRDNRKAYDDSFFDYADRILREQGI
jgi:hypothetical protein